MQRADLSHTRIFDCAGQVSVPNSCIVKGLLYSLKSLKCMFAAAKQEVNDLPETGMSEKE